MKASPAIQRRLLDLADLDAQRARLQHRANSIPEQKALGELEQARVEHRAWVARAVGELEDARTEMSRAESDVELVEQRLQRDRDRLEKTSSVKDVAALEQEITTLVRRRSDLEDIQLELMERVEGDEAELARARDAQAAVEQEAEALTVKRDEARRELQAEAKVVAASRASVVTDLPADLLELYEKQRSRYGVGAAELVGAITTGSNVTLDHVDLQKVLQAAPDEVVLCPDSSAILVRTDRSAKP